MQAQVEIGFEQLVQLAKQLPQTQWTKLKQEVETQTPGNNERENFRNLLLNGPTFSKKQLDQLQKRGKKLMNGGQNNLSRHFHSD